MSSDPRCRNRWRWFAGGALLVLLGAVMAQGVPESLRKQLDALPAAQRDRIYRNASAWSAMSPQQQATFRQRIADWHALPVEQKRERRERWQAWNAMPASEHARLDAAATAFAALGVQEQLALREQFDALDVYQQRGWLLGPDIGADWDAIHPLLKYAPPAQRQGLLEALRAMNKQQRVDLGVLARRTPPQSRDGLRKSFLDTPAAGRGQWLVEQLER